MMISNYSSLSKDSRITLIKLSRKILKTYTTKLNKIGSECSARRHPQQNDEDEEKSASVSIFDQLNFGLICLLANRSKVKSTLTIYKFLLYI